MSTLDEVRASQDIKASVSLKPPIESIKEDQDSAADQTTQEQETADCDILKSNLVSITHLTNSQIV